MIWLTPVSNRCHLGDPTAASVCVETEMRKFLGGVLVGIILVPVGFLFVLLAGFWPSAATSQPPAWESRLALRALQASVERAVPSQSNPITASEENLLAGMKTYKNGCAGCHGDAGGPSHWGTTSFYPRVPQFAQQPPRLTAPQMFWIVKHGVRYTGMAAWDGLISDDEIWKVVTFLSQLEHLPTGVAQEFHKKH
jgi:mono/diheme cytochrome c family protein